ncbi:MAG: CPBP family intramembrane metalloprotease, partial [Oscillospiraceae bacterium]|nr:CPBP family intramembrane metalloprotease [Oscillospiraceae bacterium]
RKHKNLILFLLISFLLPLVAFVSQTIIPNDSVCFVLYGIQAAAPTISAIVVLCLNKKVKTHFTQIFRKEHLRIAIILPIIIACTTMVLAKLIYCVLFGLDFMLGNISTAQFIIILWAFVAEEIGWRGYLEPLLKTYSIPKQTVPFIVGMIWCLWHYHFFLQNGIEIPILLFFISCIVESYIYSFLMSVTGDNIVSAMTYHLMWNLLIHLAEINPADNNGSIFPYIVLVVLETMLLPVFLALKRYKKSSKNT